MKFHMFLFWLLFGFPLTIYGQDDLLGKLMEKEIQADEKVTGTFKGTRLINGHSVETRNEGVLDVLISHRFGRLNSGAYQLFGLDQANIRLGLEYGFSDRLNVGVGRNSFQKVFDGFVKYKILWQESGEGMPVSMVWLSNLSINSLRLPELRADFSRRLGHTQQLLIARKFDGLGAIQIAPSYVRKNAVIPGFEELDLFVLGLGGSYKITKRTSLNLEYFYQLNRPSFSTFKNAFAVGVDIETGGHVFQLHFTNAQSMTETGFIPETTGDFFNGDIHFGFNISRTFQLKETRNGRK